MSRENSVFFFLFLRTKPNRNFSDMKEKQMSLEKYLHYSLGFLDHKYLH